MESPITYFLQSAALGFTAAISPGPFQTYLISESLSGGWKRGAPVAFVPLITDAPIILFSLFILERLPDYFLRVVSVGGGLFAFYLAWRLYVSWQTGEGEIPSESSGSSLGRGVVTNFLSPGPYLFWGLVNGPILLAALRTSALHGASFLFGFYSVFVVCLIFIALVFAQARRFGPRLVRWLLLISAGILAVFGGVLLYQGIWG